MKKDNPQKPEVVVIGPGEPYHEPMLYTKRSGAGLLIPLLIGMSEVFRPFTTRIYRTKEDITPQDIAIKLKQKATEKRARKMQKRLKGGVG